MGAGRTSRAACGARPELPRCVRGGGRPEPGGDAGRPGTDDRCRPRCSCAAVRLRCGVRAVRSQHSGCGQVVDCASVDASLLMAAKFGTTADPAVRPRHRLRAPYYGVYATADGQHMAVAAVEPRSSTRLCSTGSSWMRTLCPVSTTRQPGPTFARTGGSRVRGARRGALGGGVRRARRRRDLSALKRGRAWRSSAAGAGVVHPNGRGVAAESCAGAVAHARLDRLSVTDGPARTSGRYSRSQATRRRTSTSWSAQGRSPHRARNRPADRPRTDATA